MASPTISTGQCRLFPSVPLHRRSRSRFAQKLCGIPKVLEGLLAVYPDGESSSILVSQAATIQTTKPRRNIGDSTPNVRPFQFETAIARGPTVRRKRKPRVGADFLKWDGFAKGSTLQ